MFVAFNPVLPDDCTMGRRKRFATVFSGALAGDAPGGNAASAQDFYFDPVETQAWHGVRFKNFGGRVDVRDGRRAKCPENGQVVKVRRWRIAVSASVLMLGVCNSLFGFETPSGTSMRKRNWRKPRHRI